MLFLSLSWLIMYFSSEIPATYYALYVQALGGSAVTIGIIAFVSTISQALVQFPGGYLADKYGRRWLLSTMTFCLALSYAFYAFAPNWETIMIGAVISNLCMIYSPALNAIMMDSLPSEKRGTGFSFIYLVANISKIPSPLIAGLLYMKLGLIPGMRIGYTVVVAAHLVAAVLRLRLKETIKEPERIDGHELLRSYPRSILESFRVWKVVPRSALVLFLTDTILLLSITTVQPYLVIYAVEDLGISFINWSLIMTGLLILMIVLAIPCGKLIDKIGKKIPILFSCLFLVLGAVLFIYSDLIRLCIAMTFLRLGQILLMVAISALYTDLVPKAQRGKVHGFRGFFTLIGISFSQLLGGILYENVSHQMPFYMQIIFIVPSFLLTLLFLKEPNKKKNS